MYIKRNIDKELLKWKSQTGRKPLLLRGARQVGKTETVRNLAKNFNNFLEINFEENKRIHTIFESNLSPNEICENLSAIYNMAIIEGKTLLFFDEIQSCLPAIQSLRFFYEKMPELHLIAAGSLLEFALSEIPSFGVGRIRSMFMYPLSFNEFLGALHEDKLSGLKKKASPGHPLQITVHEKLLAYLKKFLFLGGMPEVISTYIESKDFNLCGKILDDLIFSFNDDFAKYKKRVPVARVREVFYSVIKQTGGKFIYSKVATGINHVQIKETINLLVQAGLVFPVTHTSGNGIPIGAEVNLKKTKMLLFDTGIFLRILNFKINDFLFSNDFKIINTGNVSEQFIGLELLKEQSAYQRNSLYYWHRESKSSNAEIDYLIVRNNKIVPIEVKAGTKGSMQSMFIFLKEKDANFGIRISNENFAEYENILVFPLYAVENVLKL